MTRLVAIGLWAGLGISIGVAQNSQKLVECLQTANTQLAIHMCASEEARRADEQLSAVYQKVLSAVAGQPAFIEKIRVAERAWIVYRDAYMEAMYPAKDKLNTYGSIYTTNVNLLRAELTQRQIAAVKKLLDQHSAPKP